MSFYAVHNWSTSSKTECNTIIASRMTSVRHINSCIVRRTSAAQCNTKPQILMIITQCLLDLGLFTWSLVFKHWTVWTFGMHVLSKYDAIVQISRQSDVNICRPAVLACSPNEKVAWIGGYFYSVHWLSQQCGSFYVGLESTSKYSMRS